MTVTTYEGVVEKSKIRLKSGVRLPENIKVYVIVPDMQGIGDGWHVLKVEIDSDTFAFRFYVDNTSFGQYTPDNVANLRDVNLSANIGAYADTSDAQIDVLIDEVIVTGFNK